MSDSLDSGKMEVENTCIITKPEMRAHEDRRVTCCYFKSITFNNCTGRRFKFKGFLINPEMKESGPFGLLKEKAISWWDACG